TSTKIAQTTSANSKQSQPRPTQCSTSQNNADVLAPRLVKVRPKPPTQRQTKPSPQPTNARETPTTLPHAAASRAPHTPQLPPAPEWPTETNKLRPPSASFPTPDRPKSWFRSEIGQAKWPLLGPNQSKSNPAR